MTAGAAASPLVILVIDDNRDDRELAERALRRDFPDADVRPINDAAGLAAAVEAGDFAVVITDFQLRWTDGLTVLRDVHARYPDVPVIMFTNTGNEEVCAEALRGGLFDYIIKKPSQYGRLPLSVRAGLNAAATRRRLDEALAQERAARAEAERANRLKDEFLAVVSHELRTPLNAISGYAGLLRSDDALAAEPRQWADVIERNARALARLVDELLDVSAIVTGVLRLDVGRVPVADVAAKAVQGMRPEAEAKGVRLTFAGRDGAEVKGDAARLTQVVNNLLWNAIKFTPAGGRVEVNVGRVGSTVEIRVNDTGEGITPEFLPHVFERFRQQDASTTRRHGGLGIGLAVVKHLVELHGGTVRAESAGAGRGATFVVELPG